MELGAKLMNRDGLKKHSLTAGRTWSFPETLLPILPSDSNLPWEHKVGGGGVAGGGGAGMGREEGGE